MFRFNAVRGLCLCVFGLWGSEGVGIKRKLAATSGEAGEDPPTELPGASSSTDPPVRARGGVRQRLAAEQSSSTSSSDANPLLRSLKRDWALGKLTSNQVQEYALAASSQGAVGVEALGKAGNSGNNPQNIFRALKSILGLPKGAPSLYWAEIPTKAGPSTPHPFLLPHEFFRSFFLDCPRQWEQAVSGPAGAALEFWTSMRDNVFVRKHPSLPRSSWSTTIPVGLHGDAGAFSHHDSLFTISWNSLLGVGETVAKRFLCTVIRKSDIAEGTLDAIFKVLSWSFNTMLAGKTPRLRWDDRKMDGGGAPLASGWKAALCQIRGDWQFYCEIFRFPQWNSAVSMCWMCRASSTIEQLAWTDFSVNAGWRSTRWTHEEYVRDLGVRGLLLPILFGLVVGLRLECVMVDILHSVDLGIASHIVANIFWLLAVKRSVFGPGTASDKIKLLAANLDRWYKDTKCKSRLQGALSVDRIRTSKGWPKLKGKAAQTRHLARYALHLMRTFGGRTDHDKRVLGVVQLLVRFYEICDAESMFLRPGVAAELKKLGFRMGVLYSSLAADAAAQSEKMWKMMPKMHLFVHLCEWQAEECGNPRFYWTYPDEDLVGIMVEIAESCHPRTLAMNCLFKWLHLAFDQ